jgi:hypothetical protein
MKTGSLIAVALFLPSILALSGCSAESISSDGGSGADAGQVCAASPSDDPADWTVDESVEYDIQVSEPRWVVPSEGLPKNLKLQASNNNVDIQYHCGRLYMAWRNSETHFASESTKMFVVSSADNGATWSYEAVVSLKTDVREPRFLSYKGRLTLYFFEAGTNPIAFEPIRMSRVKMLYPGKWSAAEVAMDQPEIPWDIKVRGGKAYMTSYMGAHYAVSPENKIKVFLKYSDDGDNWIPVDNAEYVYQGGVSEAAFEFDSDGTLWAELRNEDGDTTGFGSKVCSAQAGALSKWSCPAKSDPERYDSPEVFRHGKDTYLLGRKDVGGPYDEGLTNLSFEEQESKYLFDYSMRPKGFALYRIEKANKQVLKVMDLPGDGDTAFASVRRTGAHTFLFANYTSPLDMPDASWLTGQTSDRGTQIYLMDITFKAK